MNKFLSALIAGSLLIMPCANAEIISVTASDDYIMSEFETIDIAKQRAKLKALRAAQEKAGVFVESNTDVVNMMVTNDEIHTLTAGILNVSDVQFSQESLPNLNGLVIHATVTARVDTDDIDSWLNLCYILRKKGGFTLDLSGEIKKGLKVKYSTGLDSASSRTYNGLNMYTDSTLESGTLNGMYVGGAADIFNEMFSCFSNATVTSIVYNTEEALT